MCGGVAGQQQLATIQRRRDAERDVVSGEGAGAGRARPVALVVRSARLRDAVCLPARRRGERGGRRVLRRGAHAASARRTPRGAYAGLARAISPSLPFRKDRISQWQRPSAHHRRTIRDALARTGFVFVSGRFDGIFWACSLASNPDKIHRLPQTSRRARGANLSRYGSRHPGRDGGECPSSSWRRRSGRSLRRASR
jgi:hypothetical protein